MILTGEEIRKNLGDTIIIDPFDERQLNPNSYNLSLHDEVMTYEEIVLDRRPFVDRQARSIRPCYRWFWRCRLLRLLDIGDVRHSAGAHLRRGADLSDLLSHRHR